MWNALKEITELRLRLHDAVEAYHTARQQVQDLQDKYEPFSGRQT
jgi:hypothetical protein